MPVAIITLCVLLLAVIIYLIFKPTFMYYNAINRYHFKVDWGGSRLGFAEVSGLDIAIEAVSFRDGNSPEDQFRKMPGLRKFSNITLKREMVRGDNEFFDWINSKQIGNIERRNITISLLNDAHEPVVVWRVKNAFPVNYFGPVLAAGDSNLAMETLVLTHEGIEVEN